MVAYALARFRSRLNKVLFVLLLLHLFHHFGLFLDFIEQSATLIEFDSLPVGMIELIRFGYS